MNCTQCEFYSKGLRRCKLGKANPKTIKSAVEMIQFLGVSYICLKCKVRDKAVLKVRSQGHDLYSGSL